VIFLGRALDSVLASSSQRLCCASNAAGNSFRVGFFCSPVGAPVHSFDFLLSHAASFVLQSRACSEVCLPCSFVLSRERNTPDSCSISLLNNPLFRGLEFPSCSSSSHYPVSRSTPVLSQPPLLILILGCYMLIVCESLQGEVSIVLESPDQKTQVFVVLIALSR
jgi:hypothetical protein